MLLEHMRLCDETDSSFVDVGLYTGRNATSYSMTFFRPLVFPATGDGQLPPQFPSKISTTNIVLIVIAFAVLVCVVVVGGCYCYRRRSNEHALRAALGNVGHWLINPNALVSFASARVSRSTTSLTSSHSTMPGSMVTSKSSNSSMTSTALLSRQASTQALDNHFETTEHLPYCSFYYDGAPVCLFPLQNPATDQQQQAGTVRRVVDIDREFGGHLMALQSCMYSRSNENLAAFVGIVKPTTPYADTSEMVKPQAEQLLSYLNIAMAASNKGSLFAFLANTNANGEVLDEMCRFVLLRNLHAVGGFYI